MRPANEAEEVYREATRRSAETAGRPRRVGVEPPVEFMTNYRLTFIRRVFEAYM
jgi:hypothetical protein